MNYKRRRQLAVEFLEGRSMMGAVGVSVDTAVYLGETAKVANIAIVTIVTNVTVINLSINGPSHAGLSHAWPRIHYTPK